MRKLILSILPLAGLLFLAGCKEKPVDKPIVNQEPEKGLLLDFYGMFNGTAIEYKTGEYTRDNGEIMRVSNWAMILSHLSLVKTNDSLVPLGDGYLHVDFVAGKTKFPYLSVPFGDYKGISFKLGLDSAVNHGDPAIWPANHPLNANTTGLHWGWSGGYIFHALDGTWKENASASAWNGISLHTAGDNFTKEFFMPLNFSITDTNRKTARIEAWVDQYFKDPAMIDFTTDGSFSHSVGSSEVALMNKVLGNSADVFILKEVK